MGACMTPFSVKQDHKNGTIPVPCGKCPECRSRMASAWSFRLMQHERICTSSHFITLTYATEHVPITKNGYMGLDPRDLTLFFKRLRKSHSKLPDARKISYFGVGEYGEQFNRPHYHVILFNAKLELIQPAWNLGEIHYGTVTGASIGYTLKYIMKPGKIPMHQRDDRHPEMRRMSKGLGENYITPKMVKWHNTTSERMYVITDQGQKISMPRYYKDRIFKEEKRKHLGAIARLNAIEKISKEIRENPNYFHDENEYKKFKINQQKNERARNKPSRF